MVVFNTLAHAIRVPFKGRILPTTVNSCLLPILSGNNNNGTHKNIHTTGLCQVSRTQVLQKQFSITFDEYLKAKSALRNKQRFAGIPFAITGMMVSSVALTYTYPEMFEQTPENVQLILGLDPLVFSGISGVVAAGCGYVLGTAVYKFIWKKINSKSWSDLDTRDRDFLERLEKYRFGADSKFEDDYYGESIKNLSDYRQWVRTHQRKKENHAKYELTALKEKLG